MVSKPAFSPRLVIIEGRDKGKVIPLQNGTAVIGRSKGDVLIQDPRVSRSHIALHFDEKNGLLTFTDLKSLNGTLVNGEKMESGELRDGDRLQLGNTLFDCQIMPSDTDVSAKSFLRGAFKRKEPEIHSEKSLEIFSEPLPDLESLAREDLERTSHGIGLRKIRNTYLNLPRRTRIISLCVLILIAFLFLPRPPSTAPPNSEGELQKVRTLAQQGKIDEAIQQALTLKEQNPKDSQTYYTLGVLYESQKKYELALSAYEKVRELDPKNAAIHAKLIRLFLKAGLVKEAQEGLTLMEQMVKDGPRSQTLFVELGHLILEYGKELGAVPEKSLIVAKALQTEFAPENPLGYQLEASLLLQQNRAEEALGAVQKGRKIDPRDEWLLENEAFAKLTLKDNAGAMASLTEWTQAHPASTKPLLVLAYLKYNNQDEQGAMQYLQRIFQLTAKTPTDPHLPEALNLAGTIYLQQNQIQQAETSLHKACELGFQQSCESELLKRLPSAKENGSVPSPTEATPSPSNLPSNP